MHDHSILFLGIQALDCPLSMYNRIDGAACDHVEHPGSSESGSESADHHATPKIVPRLFLPKPKELPKAKSAATADLAGEMRAMISGVTSEPDLPAQGQDFPAQGQDLPAQSQDLPAQGQLPSQISQQSPAQSQDLPAQGQDGAQDLTPCTDRATITLSTQDEADIKAQAVAMTSAMAKDGTPQAVPKAKPQPVPKAKPNRKPKFFTGVTLPRRRLVPTPKWGPKQPSCPPPNYQQHWGPRPPAYPPPLQLQLQPVPMPVPVPVLNSRGLNMLEGLVAKVVYRVVQRALEQQDHRNYMQRAYEYNYQWQQCAWHNQCAMHYNSQQSATDSARSKRSASSSSSSSEPDSKRRKRGAKIAKVATKSAPPVPKAQRQPLPKGRPYPEQTPVAAVAPKASPTQSSKTTQSRLKEDPPYPKAGNTEGGKGRNGCVWSMVKGTRDKMRWGSSDDPPALDLSEFEKFFQ